MDVAGYKGDEAVYIQVSRATKKVTPTGKRIPVARERRALEDLAREGIFAEFVPYN